MFEQLPEPKRRVLSADEKYLRARQFAIVINFFVLGYNLVHKVIMPLYVNWTAKVPSLSVHHLDWWWAYHLGLYLLLRRKKWDDCWLRAAVCLGFGGVFLQIYISFKEFSWHIVSFWFTAAATIGVITYIVTITRYKAANLKNAFAIFFVAFTLGNILQFALMGFKTELMPHVEYIVKHDTKIPNEKPLVDPNQCGMTGFRVAYQDQKLEIPNPKLVQEFTVKPCGMPVVLAYFDRESGLVLNNPTKDYLNLKLNYLSKGQWRPFKNVPLRPHSKSHIDLKDMTHSLIMIFSDAHPEKGISLLIENSQNFLTEIRTQFDAQSFPQNGSLTVNRQSIFLKKQ